MKIIVTKDHIKNAIRSNSHRCMIADAIHTACKEAKYVLVDLQSIRWSNLAKRKRYICLTPPVAQLKLLKFDRGEKVKGFSFSVQPIKTHRVGWTGDPNKLKVVRSRFKAGKSKKMRRNIYRPPVEREFGLRALTV